MAKITAGVFTSHVPAIGAALDLGKSAEPYWQPLFAGYDFSKQWMKDNKPDVVFLVFNDHATAFSLEMIPVGFPSRDVCSATARTFRLSVSNRETPWLVNVHSWP